MSEDDVAWSWVTVNLAVWQDVPDDVIKALTEWFGQKYSNTERSSKATDSTVVTRRDGYTWLTFAIHRRYNPHHVGKVAEKKLNELLAARS